MASLSQRRNPDVQGRGIPSGGCYALVKNRPGTSARGATHEAPSGLVPRASMNGEGGMGPQRSKVQHVAAGVAHTMIRILKERLGRGPEGFRTYVIDDMIVIRLLKGLTTVEYEHAKTLEGRQSIKEVRNRLLDDLGPSLGDAIRTSTGAGVVSIHSDLSTKTGETLVIFVLDHAIRDLPTN